MVSILTSFWVFKSPGVSSYGTPGMWKACVAKWCKNSGIHLQVFMQCQSCRAWHNICGDGYNSPVCRGVSIAVVVLAVLPLLLKAWTGSSVERANSGTWIRLFAVYLNEERVQTLARLPWLFTDIYRLFYSISLFPFVVCFSFWGFEIDFSAFLPRFTELFLYELHGSRDVSNYSLGPVSPNPSECVRLSYLTAYKMHFFFYKKKKKRLKKTPGLLCLLYTNVIPDTHYCRLILPQIISTT